MRKIKMSHDGNSRVYDQLYEEIHNMTIGDLYDCIDKNVKNETDKKHIEETLSELIKLFCLTEFDKRSE